MKTTQKSPFISQLTGFWLNRELDKLGPIPTAIYMTIFFEFNRTFWRKKWVKLTIRAIMEKTCIGSTHTVQQNCRLLEEMGYIKMRLVRQGKFQFTEYRLTEFNREGDLCGEDSCAPQYTFDSQGIPCSGHRAAEADGWYTPDNITAGRKTPA
ncbi:MAG: hypothetical protein UHB38_02855 [Anaerovibrio sp.]|uniref:hypothetical protein n=1 Tax=Anaerovibrio sp. TaxID=1872532 RepID=UPI002E7A66DE|nr:hypothetical protein [Anaerovibrio sp.]MBQ5586322.1 hypothetical protein [Selenomonadaceae bacterium]MEE1306907.1 hypothetical protein [Anaerovibrio sp.]